MGRIRTIKPQFFTDDEIADLPLMARYLFIGLWTAADREGRLEDRPRRIKTELAAYDDCNVDELLDLLAARRFIIRYRVNGNAYIQIRTFDKHQHVNIRESKSIYPPYDPDTCTLSPGNGDEGLSDSRTCTHVNARGEGKGKEWNGKEGEEVVKLSPRTDASARGRASACLSFSELGVSARREPKARLPDPEYLAELQAKAAYRDLNVAHVHAKLVAWCEVNGKQPTRRRLINWLNREDRPLQSNGKSEKTKLDRVVQRIVADRQRNSS